MQNFFASRSHCFHLFTPFSLFSFIFFFFAFAVRLRSSQRLFKLAHIENENASECNAKRKRNRRRRPKWRRRKMWTQNNHKWNQRFIATISSFCTFVLFLFFIHATYKNRPKEKWKRNEREKTKKISEKKNEIAGFCCCLFPSQKKKPNKIKDDRMRELQ